MIEGTQPHAPYNVSGTATEFQVTLRWHPGYAGGPDYKQDYTIWYREAGFSEWTKVPVTPSGATSVSIIIEQLECRLVEVSRVFTLRSWNTDGLFKAVVARWNNASGKEECNVITTLEKNIY